MTSAQMSLIPEGRIRDNEQSLPTTYPRVQTHMAVQEASHAHKRVKVLIITQGTLFSQAGKKRECRRHTHAGFYFSRAHLSGKSFTVCDLICCGRRRLPPIALDVSALG